MDRSVLSSSPNLAVRRRPRERTALARLRGQAGFTMVEIMVAMLLLLVGMLATFILVGNANATLSKTRAREAATNLARGLLEDARDTPYSQIGQSGWFTSNLQNVSGGSGSVTNVGSNGLQTTVQRRGVSFAVTFSWCSVDDSGDGYGAHSSSVSWCSDSGTVSTTDPQPEDFKRAIATINWSFAGKAQPAMVQTAMFSATGAASGPTTTDLQITSPSGLNSTQPVITSNPASGILTFLGTSVGAADMKFFVDSSEQLTGTTSNNNGTWSFNWNILSVPDGVYTINAVAVDALGNRGAPRALQVKLARGAVAAPANIVGGYNYVYSSNARTLVVELNWDANVEGSVTGYQVNKGSTVVCSASLSLECIDFSPASNGSTTYTIKTLYTDASGSTQSVSANYVVTAPSPPQPSYVGNIGSDTCGDNTMSVTVPSGGVSAGNRVIVRLALRGTTGSSAGISDTRGNTWTADVDDLNVDERIVVWSSHLTTALQPGDTIRVAYPDASSQAVVADAFTGVASSNAVDARGSAEGNSSSPTASVTTTAANELLVGAVAIFNQLSVNAQPSGWTGLTTLTAGCGHGSGGNGTNVGGYRVGSSAGSYTYNPALSGAGRWATGVVAYKAATNSGLAVPGTPTGLTASTGPNGGTVLTWNAPSGSPGADFYRIYRDGQNYTDRYETAADSGTSTVTWTETRAGATTHTYRVTAVSTNLAESAFAGPVSG